MLIKFINRYNSDEKVVLAFEPSHKIDYVIFCLAKEILHLPQFLRLYASCKSCMRLENQRTLSDYSIQKNALIYFKRNHTHSGVPLCPYNIIRTNERRLVEKVNIYNNFFVSYLPFIFSHKMRCSFTLEELVGTPNGTIIKITEFNNVVSFMDGTGYILFNSGRSYFTNGLYCLTVKITDVDHRPHGGDCHKYDGVIPERVIQECFIIVHRKMPRASSSSLK